MVTLAQNSAPTVGTLDRRDVVSTILRGRGNALVVTGLGSASYDVHAAGDDDRNYYLWGAMGAAALTGLDSHRHAPTIVSSSSQATASSSWHSEHWPRSGSHSRPTFLSS